MKKTIAIFLVVMMLLSALPVFASKTTEQKFSTDKIEGEVIIPFSKAVAEGEYKSSTAVPGYDGKAHYWGSGAVTYKLNNIKKGRYELFFWVCPHPVCKDKLDFEVFHAGETASTFVYQRLNEGEVQEPGWVSLGVYEFNGDGKEYVKMLDAGQSSTRHSGLKYVPTTKDVTVEPVEQEVNVSSEGIPVIGEKMPNSTSKLTDITVEPDGTCKWVGDWAFSSAVSTPMKDYPSSMWIAGVGEEAYVTYNPAIEAVGDVNIFVHLPWWHENQNPNVKYEVHHNGKVDEVMLNPATLEESAWIYLGTYDFAGKPDEEFVKLVCQENENKKANTRASTIMFEIVNSAGGGIWQTKYVTPINNAETILEGQKATMAPLDKFTDMVDHWAHYDVEYMANEGLVSGVSDTEFDPEAQITRAEYVTILDRAMGYELITGESYADVAQDAWFATYVATAKANGLLNGLPTEDGFKPEQPITREEMALFTYNAIKATKKNDVWVANMPDGWDNFSDTAEVSDWAKEALRYLIRTEIIKGTSDTTVSAKENATRAQGAVILKRFMQLFVWAGPPVDQEWELMFYDEFLGNEVNWGVWRSDASAPGHIESSRWPENVEQHDGALHLVIRKEERGGKQWTAGSVWVRPEVFSQTYGYWEARYKIAAAPGINNSFWTYVPGAFNIHKLPDTKTHFELDVNEGHYPNKVNMTYHSSDSGTSKSYSQTYKSPYDLSVDYHTYALEWTPTELRYYHDGVLRSVQENLNAHQLQFPYLSSAVINWAGLITDEADGTAQIIDYVRVWQKKEDADDPALNFKGEPMVDVAPEEQGTSDVVSPNASLQPPPAPETFETTTETFPDEILIPFNKAKTSGKWTASTAVAGYDGGPHYWAGTGDDITYQVKGVKKGKYEVYYWVCPHASCQAVLTFDVLASGENNSASIRQQLKEGETAEPGWASLGTYDFTGDGKEYIKLTGTGGNIRSSAVKFVPVK